MKLRPVLEIHFENVYEIKNLFDSLSEKLKKSFEEISAKIGLASRVGGEN